MKVNKRRREILGLILVLISLGLILYGQYFSSSARIKKNLADFDQVTTFRSQELSAEDLDQLDRPEEGYSFLVLEKDDLAGYQHLGSFDLLDEKGEVLTTMDLYRQGDSYLVQARGVYMTIN